MTTLRETPAPHVRPDPAQRPRREWRPLELFADHAMAARLWCVVALIAVTLPVRRDVAGLSMAPGLMPGDRVTTGALPWRDRFRSPAIDERWIAVLPDGTEAVKRIAATGPGTLRIVDGDLERDGRIAPPPPDVFSERATVVREMVVRGKTFSSDGEELQVVSAGEPIFDDAAFAPNERRLLLPVADVGVCVVVRVDQAVTARSEAARSEPTVVIGVGDRQVGWRPSGPGLFAFLAGRIDRHLVAVAWSIADRAACGAGCDRGPLRLPPDPPPNWSFADAWGGGDTHAAPGLTISVSELPAGPGASSVVIERAILWRDVFYRPATDGATEWSLDSGEVDILIVSLVLVGSLTISVKLTSTVKPLTKFVNR